MHEMAGRLWRAVLAIGADPRDDPDLRDRKRLLVVAAVMVLPAGLIWGALYRAFDEPLAATIPWGYTSLSLASIAIFALNRRFPLFRLAQLSLILLLPFLLMLTLGGFEASSAIILWSLLCPFGALLFSEPREAPRWLIAFLGIVALGAVLQPLLRPDNALPEAVRFLFFVLNIATVSTVAFVLLFYFAVQREIALGKADGLLLNILPKVIAEKLKNESGIIADHFESASILFADVVDFTPLSAALGPKEVVGLLDGVFSHFDGLVEEIGLEKIKTIGDCYMVAAGVPAPRPDHARALALLALEMRDYCSGIVTPGGRPLDLRIGINSGPVVAGVIGRRKFIYDLWGDAVNTASRMESQGTPGTIQITAATRELLEGEFVCERRGTIQVKGKGEMETWYLVGRGAQPDVADPSVVAAADAAYASP
ncbi:MAG: hypothetical protein A2X23_09525 [Chloroflexi bacterium GWC2_73_18]|nr:MAG: hypothetical protein A2X23_09525 [Chloroflexi bacterium GWC2_73_18]